MRLQVRASPTKAPIRKKQTKKQQPTYPSTNVSSPIRAPKKNIRDFAYQQQNDESDDDHFAKPRHPTRDQKSRSRRPDNFDDDFAQIRVAKPPRAAKPPKGLGKPITVDERTAGLSGLEQDALWDFVNGAKNLRKDIMTNYGHRQAVFSDTVLREMGLRLPNDLEEMKLIPGIRPEMVDRYGRRFMLLIDNTREMYGGSAPGSRGGGPQRPQVVEELSDDDYEEDDEEVYDPNHQEQNIIDLCGESDNDVPPAAEDSESDYSYGESDDDEALRRSHHFTQVLDPEVEQFNNRLTQTMGTGGASTSKASAPKRAARASTSGPKKKGSYRKSGGSFGGRGSFSGVRKRAGSKVTGAARKPAGGGSRRGAGAGGGGAPNGWGGIMTMPT